MDFSADLEKIYNDFGNDIPMKITPFVFNYKGQGIYCFDEAQPCVLEQISECLIEQTNDQHKYVPWLLCMDKEGDSGETQARAETCATSLGIDYSKVSECQTSKGTAILSQLADYSAKKGINGTPMVLVNGKSAASLQSGPTYENVKAAICKADSSLAACASTVAV